MFWKELQDPWVFGLIPFLLQMSLQVADQQDLREEELQIQVLGKMGGAWMVKSEGNELEKLL